MKPRLVGYRDNRNLAERIISAIAEDGTPLERFVAYLLTLLVVSLTLLMLARWFS